MHTSPTGDPFLDVLNSFDSQFPASKNSIASFHSDPHYTGFKGQQYSLQPIEESLIIRSKTHPFEIHGYHQGFGYGATYCTQIAIKFGSNVVIYDAYSKELTSNSQSVSFCPFGSAEKATEQYKEDFGKSFLFRRNQSRDSFELYVYFNNNGVKFFAKTSVNSYGTLLPWIRLSITMPTENADQCEDALIGSALTKNPGIISGDIRVSLFPNKPTNPNFPKQIPTTPKVFDPNQRQEARSQILKVLGNQMVDNRVVEQMVIDYLNTPPLYQEDIIQESLKAVQQFEKEKKVIIEAKTKDNCNETGEHEDMVIYVYYNQYHTAIDVNYLDSIQVVKEKIRSVLGLELSRIILVFGKDMIVKGTLADNNIVHESTLNIK